MYSFLRSCAIIILYSNSFLSSSYLVFKTNLLVLILFTLATNLSYTVYLTTSFFTTSLSVPKSIGTGTNLSISNLSISDFKLSKFDFSTKLEVLTCEISSISVFVAQLDKSTSTLISAQMVHTV